MPPSTKPTARICLFGDPRVYVNGSETPGIPPPRFSAAMLLRLAQKPGKPITRDEIADFLWPDEALDATRQRVREYLYQLRKAIPSGKEMVATEGDTIYLSPEFDITVDTLEFDKLLKQAGETANLARKAGLLSQADALYTAPVAPDLDWLMVTGLRTHYADHHLEILRALSQLASEHDFDSAIEYGLRAVTAEPLCEGAQEELIRLYFQAGRPDEARRQYREFENLLRRELNEEPSREITEFVRRIPANGTPHSPVGSLRVAPLPARRAARIYRAVAALSLVVALVAVAASTLRSRPAPPPPSPEERMAMVVRLGKLAVKDETAKEAEPRHREQSEQCIALGEEAFKGWYNKYEDDWISRLAKIDAELQQSLKWLAENDPPKAVQLAGTLTRYWLIHGDMGLQRHWLALVKKAGPETPILVRARALTGLSLTYLFGSKAELREGIRLAGQALNLCREANDPWGQAQALRHMGLFERAIGRDKEALKHYRMALQLYTQAGSESGLALTYQVMTAIPPKRSRGMVTDAQWLGWALSASNLFRKVENPRGSTDAQDLLNGIARTVCASSETIPELRLVEVECRAWLRIEKDHNDLSNQRELWKTLATAGLKLGDKHLMAEALPALCAAKDPRMPVSEYLRPAAQMAGAYQKHRKWNRHPENVPASFKPTFVHRGLSRAEQAHWMANVELGKRMTLEQAVRVAIDF